MKCWQDGPGDLASQFLASSPLLLLAPGLSLLWGLFFPSFLDWSAGCLDWPEFSLWCLKRFMPAVPAGLKFPDENNVLPGN